VFGCRVFYVRLFREQATCQRAGDEALQQLNGLQGLPIQQNWLTEFFALRARAGPASWPARHARAALTPQDPGAGNKNAHPRPGLRRHPIRSDRHLILAPATPGSGQLVECQCRPRMIWLQWTGFHAQPAAEDQAGQTRAGQAHMSARPSPSHALACSDAAVGSKPTPAGPSKDGAASKVKH